MTHFSVVEECNFQMLMKHRVRAPTAAVPALLPPSKVAGTRGRVGMAVTQISFHISFQLHNWILLSSQMTTDALTTKQRGLRTP